MKRCFTAMLAVAALAAPNIATAATPSENLDCAIWASVSMDENTDPDIVNGLGFTLSWFIGLYEGATGQAIDDAMVDRLAAMTDAEFEALEPGCLERMGQFGSRLGALAERLQSTGN